MSSLKSRVLVSVVGVPLLLWVVLGAPTIVMVVALCVLAGIGAYELQQCVSGNGKKDLGSTSAIMAMLTVLWYWRGAENVAVLVFVAAVLFFGFAIIKGGEEKFAQLKKNYRNVILSAMDRNGYWIDNFVVNYLLGKDMHQGYMAEIANITANDFCSFIEKLYRRGNRITVVMEGTTQDVNTQNLFRENQFIRDYFDL
jgi:hypothetical protein